MRALKVPHLRKSACDIVYIFAGQKTISVFNIDKFYALTSQNTWICLASNGNLAHRDSHWKLEKASSSVLSQLELYSVEKTT